ncbi:MAG: hypothetical protein ACK5Y8_01745, partial [Betaproteobacteria bacterium]
MKTPSYTIPAGRACRRVPASPAPDRPTPRARAPLQGLLLLVGALLLPRQALAEGDMDRAASLLGRPYAISGRAVHGRK